LIEIRLWIETNNKTGLTGVSFPVIQINKLGSLQSITISHVLVTWFCYLYFSGRKPRSRL